MTKEKLTNDILATIAGIRKNAKRDCKTSETLLLIAMLSSFITATLAVNKYIDRSIIAVFGGLSGIIIIYYKAFSYSNRSTWNILYRFDLQRLLNELEVAEPSIVAEKYIALQEKRRESGKQKNLNAKPLVKALPLTLLPLT